MSSKSSSSKTKSTGASKRLGRLAPVLCNIFGTLLFVGVVALAAPLAVPRVIGLEVYDVVSGSMEPAIPVGSVVYVRPGNPDAVVEGDVIAFYGDEGVVVHRVVANRTSVGEFATKGDANQEADPDPVPYEAYVGTMTRSIPHLGKFMTLYSSTVGKIYLLLAAACGVMLNMLAYNMRSAQSAQLSREIRTGAVSVTDAAGTAATEAEAAEVAAPPKRRRLRLRTVLMVILALIFIGSAGVVGFVTFERAQSDRIYGDASDRFTQAGDGDKETCAPIMVDFDELCAVNEDVVGWLYCEGTPINYPVLQGRDNNEYLRTDYTREYNINGSLFVDCDNNKGFTDANTIIYGHHMNHGAMFATLEEWAAQKYYEEHRVFWLLTPEQDYQVVLVSGHHTSAYSDMYDIYHLHDEKFARYLQEAVDQSDFTPVDKATVNPDRNYVMLTTCAYIFNNARYVLHGKLVPVDSAGGVPK